MQTLNHNQKKTNYILEKILQSQRNMEKHNIVPQGMLMQANEGSKPIGDQLQVPALVSQTPQKPQQCTIIFNN